MERDKRRSSAGPTLRQTLRDDLRHGGFWRSVRKDWGELKEYSIDDDKNARLSAMGPFKRRLVTGWWVLKQMILRLTPARRILVVVGIAFLLLNTTVQHEQLNNQPFFGGLILLFVLLLELKDRLLAWDELQAGRAVQRELLPDTSPEIPGWSIWISTRPANEVGGDLVDYLQISPDRTALVIADVSGKGLRAALLMAKLQTIVRTLAGEHTTLPKLAVGVNDAFRRERLPSIFASMIYLELTSGTGRIRYVNAGHLPPVVLHGGGVSFAEKGDAAIGLMAQTGYTERAAELDLGDVLLCYSDGLTEARDKGGAFFGTERLAALLPPLLHLTAPEIGRSLVAAADQFTGDVRAHDDLSLVVIKKL